MGSTDAQRRRRPVDGLEARVLHLASLPADRCRGLALCGHRLLLETPISYCLKEKTRTRSWVRTFCFDVFIYLISFVIHACSDDSRMYMQMSTQSDQLVCLT